MSSYTLDATSVDRRVYIIDDLLGAILLIATAALAVLLDLTRRQICAVYQLAFALCATCAFFLVGGLIDHHLSNDQLHVALYGSYLSSSLTTSYVYLPTLASIGISLVVLLSLSTCSCDCCCLAGASSSTHQRCFGSRIRSNLSLYGTCLITLYVAIGTRLNVRLRESAINPVGGTVHWALLRAPFYLAIAHSGSVLLVALKLFLQHADRLPHVRHSGIFSPTESVNTLPPAPTTVQELMRPPPVKSFPLAPPRRTSDSKLTLPRSPQTATPLVTSETRTVSPRSIKTTVRRDTDNNREPQNDGDVSALISSDSESDDGILRPSFRATQTTTTKTLPPRHGSSGGRRRPSGGTGSGYSSSPPASPTRSTISTGSSSSSRVRANNARPGSASSTSSSTARPRLTSSGSSSSTTFLSDSDDHVLSNLEAYGSSGTEGAFLSDQRTAHTGIRRRAPSIGSSGVRRQSNGSKLHHEPSELIECMDDATGSAYYYNTRTGESRWRDH